ncbi:hypothetical protein TIFTF001_034515 [Ficus carica]|uniref:Uncharacterized protein n=1 Tax=Ficus carica TaxID=3494 RepID=A0AA88E0D0_FICCA|nr:hypothetical protein TIFTF001_034515 [Ficus carica]
MGGRRSSTRYNSLFARELSTVAIFLTSCSQLPMMGGRRSSARCNSLSPKADGHRNVLCRGMPAMATVDVGEKTKWQRERVRREKQG